jgi:hypothetical protein
MVVDGEVQKRKDLDLINLLKNKTARDRSAAWFPGPSPPQPIHWRILSRLVEPAHTTPMPPVLVALHRRLAVLPPPARFSHRCQARVPQIVGTPSASQTYLAPTNVALILFRTVTGYTGGIQQPPRSL